MPLARKSRVDAELRQLVEDGVLTAVDQSDWATPIVVVEKSDGGVRICGDYRDTVNLVLKPEGYPLPTLDESFAQLHGASIFSKIDLTRAYNQVLVDEDTSKLLTLNTHRGLFKVNRLWFGVAVAPPRFQKLVDGLLGGIEGVVVLLDDVLVTGRTMSEHDHRLREVLRKLSEAGLRINPNKSLFRASQVQYLGHVVSAMGIEPLRERVEALLLAPEPENVDHVRSFLGKVNFYEKFIPNRADLLEPLHRLLPHDAQWTWGDEQAGAYKAVKELLCSSPLLVHYSLELPLVLSVDASPYGVGAVLAHEIDGFERPIAYASRTLNSAEKNYAQFDKEGLAIIFGILKFHQYVAGRTFVVYTDHKPLVGLFGGKTPKVTSPRLMRWLMTASAYSFEVRYRPGKEHGNADMLSRLPLPCPYEGDPPEPPIRYVYYLDLDGQRQPDTPPVTADQIGEATSACAELRQVRAWAREGWPNVMPPGELGEFWKKRDQISVTRDCVLWGDRVVVPKALRQDAMARLHSSHAGMVRSKAMARVTFWYPGLDAEIERVVASCTVCQRHRPDPPHAAYLSWPRDRPWGRVHLDFGQPTQKEHFLVAVDAETRWIEAWWVPSENTQSVIKCLRSVFSRFGDPELIVSDNGSAFVSEEFQQFLEARGIRQLTIARECSWSNGLAERAVGVIKSLLPRFQGTKEEQLCAALEQTRFYPNGDGWAPAEAMLGRQPMTALRRMVPLAEPREVQPERDRGGPLTQAQTFAVGEPVWIRSFKGKNHPRWIPAVTVRTVGGRLWWCKAENGDLWKRHISQIRRREMPRGKKRVYRRPMGELGEDDLRHHLNVERHQEAETPDEQPGAEPPKTRDVAVSASTASPEIQVVIPEDDDAMELEVDPDLNLSLSEGEEPSEDPPQREGTRAEAKPTSIGRGRMWEQVAARCPGAKARPTSIGRGRPLESRPLESSGAKCPRPGPMGRGLTVGPDNRPAKEFLNRDPGTKAGPSSRAGQHGSSTSGAQGEKTAIAAPRTKEAARKHLNQKRAERRRAARGRIGADWDWSKTSPSQRKREAERRGRDPVTGTTVTRSPKTSRARPAAATKLTYSDEVEDDQDEEEGPPPGQLKSVVVTPSPRRGGRPPRNARRPARYRSSPP